MKEGTQAVRDSLDYGVYKLVVNKRKFLYSASLQRFSASFEYVEKYSNENKNSQSNFYRENQKTFAKCIKAFYEILKEKTAAQVKETEIHLFLF